MADNFAFSEGSGKTGAAKEVGGVLYPEVIQVETDGTATGTAAKLGSVTETAPTTDTASSGLNGRLQRIAQRLTSLIALLPSALSSGGYFKVYLGDLNPAANSLPVAAAQASFPWSVTEADGTNVTLGSKADNKSTATDTTAITIMSVLKQVSASVQAIATSIAGTLTVATHAVTQSGTWTVQPGNTANTTAWKVDGSAVTQPISVSSLPLPSGAATETTLGGVLTTSDFDTKAGSLTETAPATDTASSGLNGRLQRIAQRLTTLLAVFPTTIDTNSGSKSASTLRVVLATDQPALTNKLLVTPDSVALPANQSVNISQINAHTALEAGTNGALAVGGGVATNVAITTNPINNGAQGVSSENSAITTGRMVQLVADLVGKLIVLPYANPENFVNGTTAAITDTTSTSTIAAQGAGVRTYITQITVTNSHATVGTFVKILDGATIIHEGYAAAAGGGYTASFPTPLRGTANTAVNTQPVTTGANVIASVSGYKGA